MSTFNELMGLVPEDYEGLDYSEREKIKSDGWSLYNEGKNNEEKAGGALKIIFAHFHRSRESALIEKREHPELNEYIGHWLWSNDEAITGEPRALLDGLFPHPKQSRIEKGKSYFY